MGSMRPDLSITSVAHRAAATMSCRSPRSLNCEDIIPEGTTKSDFCFVADIGSSQFQSKKSSSTTSPNFHDPFVSKNQTTGRYANGGIVNENALNSLQNLSIKRVMPRSPQKNIVVTEPPSTCQVFGAGFWNHLHLHSLNQSSEPIGFCSRLSAFLMQDKLQDLGSNHLLSRYTLYRSTTW